jgi:hypothetical protein
MSRRHLSIVRDEASAAPAASAATGVNVNCASWTVCCRDSAGHVTLVEAHTEHNDLVDIEVFLCEQHAVAVGLTGCAA